MNQLSSVCLTNFILIKGLTKQLKSFLAELVTLVTTSWRRRTNVERANWNMILLK